MTKKQAEKIATGILNRYASVYVNDEKVAAYAKELEEFDYNTAREACLNYCRSREGSSAPSAFDLRRAVRAAAASKSLGQGKEDEAPVVGDRKVPPEARKLLDSLATSMKWPI